MAPATSYTVISVHLINFVLSEKIKENFKSSIYKSLIIDDNSIEDLNDIEMSLVEIKKIEKKFSKNPKKLAEFELKNDELLNYITKVRNLRTENNSVEERYSKTKILISSAKKKVHEMKMLLLDKEDEAKEEKIKEPINTLKNKH